MDPTPAPRIVRPRTLALTGASLVVIVLAGVLDRPSSRPRARAKLFEIASQLEPLAEHTILAPLARTGSARDCDAANVYRDLFERLPATPSREARAAVADAVGSALADLATASQFQPFRDSSELFDDPAWWKGGSALCRWIEWTATQPAGPADDGLLSLAATLSADLCRVQLLDTLALAARLDTAIQSFHGQRSGTATPAAATPVLIDPEDWARREATLARCLLLRASGIPPFRPLRSSNGDPLDPFVALELWERLEHLEALLLDALEDLSGPAADRYDAWRRELCSVHAEAGSWVPTRAGLRQLERPSVDQ